MLLTLVLLLSTSCGEDGEKFTAPPNPQEGNGGKETETTHYHVWAKELSDIVNMNFRINSGVFAGLYKGKMQEQTVSFLWAYDSMVSASATIFKLGYQTDYTAVADNYERYLLPKAIYDVPGYSSGTNGTTGNNGTRFYDDNSIVGISLIEAYRLTDEKRFLDRARKIVDFLKTGLIDVGNGEALWWNEIEANNPRGKDEEGKLCKQPTCANGYAANFLIQLYMEMQKLGNQKEAVQALTLATQLYNWLYNNLRNPIDGTYYNDMRSDGTIVETYYTYNSGIMIQNAILLYEITQKPEYLSAAKNTARGAANRFIKERNGVKQAWPSNCTWFNVKLFNGFVMIEPYMSEAKVWIESYITYADNGWKHARTADGLLYEDWTAAQTGRVYELLQQGGNIESLTRIALYKKDKAE